MVIAWTSGPRNRLVNPTQYMTAVMFTWHAGDGGAFEAVAVVGIREVPKEWGIQDPTIARALREQSDRINRIINKLGELV